MAKLSDKGLIVKKVGMTRMVDTDGKLIPVTLLQVTEQRVCKVLSAERDGYHAYQVGYFPKAVKNLSKADVQRLRKVSVDENFARFREFRTPGAPEGLEIGLTLEAALFKDVAAVDITGITKGRGFQGAVRRWGASIGRMTHGSRFHRRPGSLGMRSTPGRVFKNKPQPGQMGDVTCTLRNLKVVDVDTVHNVIAIKGSVPGHREGFLELRPTNKK